MKWRCCAAGDSSATGAEGPAGAGRARADAAERTLAGEDRDAGDAASLAPATGLSALDLPTEEDAIWRSSAYRGSHPGAGCPPCPGEPDLCGAGGYVEAGGAALLGAVCEPGCQRDRGSELHITFGAQRSSSHWMMSLLTCQRLSPSGSGTRGGQRSIALRFIAMSISMYSLVVVMLT